MLRELLAFLRFDFTIDVSRVTLDVKKDAVLFADRIKLQQVFVNLLRNAAHALEGRQDGAIRIVVDADDDHSMLQVEDNGCGMNEETRQRIWEPFFSTKGEKGTGLGLDVCRNLIQQHDGEIDCQSEPGLGTTFMIRLPAVDGELRKEECLVGRV